MKLTKTALMAWTGIVLLVNSCVVCAQTPNDQTDDRSLVNSDGSHFVPKDFYPKFSWDTTPRYFMFGDKARLLRPEQVRFIAEQTDFL